MKFLIIYFLDLIFEKKINIDIHLYLGHHLNIRMSKLDKVYE